MSSNNFYLVVRDVKTNEYETIKEFETLEEADLYTTDYHNNRELAKHVWGKGIVPSQDLDFFIVKSNNKNKYFDVMEVLFSDSKEVKCIIKDNNNAKHNLLDHFYYKMTHSNEFYNVVMDNVVMDNPSISNELKEYYLQRYSKKCDNKKDSKSISTITYPTIRNILSSLSTYEKSKDIKSNSNYRFLLERELIGKVDIDEKQIDMFEKIKKESIDTDKLIEVLDSLENLPEGFLYVKKGEAHISYNMYTMNDNLDVLDSLLDERLGIVLNDYINYREMYKNSLNQKYKKILKESKLMIIDILTENKYVLDKTYKLTRIINRDQSNLLGDEYGYQYKK